MPVDGCYLRPKTSPKTQSPAASPDTRPKTSPKTQSPATPLQKIVILPPNTCIDCIGCDKTFCLMGPVPMKINPAIGFICVDCRKTTHRTANLFIKGMQHFLGIDVTVAPPRSFYRVCSGSGCTLMIPRKIPSDRDCRGEEVHYCPGCHHKKLLSWTTTSRGHIPYSERRGD